MPPSNTSRIAKNTLLLYFRMLLTMAVPLYTSRIILNALGVEDYGIYNVVGGVCAGGVDTTDRLITNLTVNINHHGLINAKKNT